MLTRHAYIYSMCCHCLLSFTAAFKAFSLHAGLMPSLHVKAGANDSVLQLIMEVMTQLEGAYALGTGHQRNTSAHPEAHQQLIDL